MKIEVAVVQAVISAIAILASGGIAVLVPWLSRRADARSGSRRRLSLLTHFNAPTGLRLELRYLPEFTHLGIRARITLVEPTNVNLHAGKYTLGVQMTTNGTHFFAQADGVCMDGIALLQLGNVFNDGTLSGVFYLLPSADPSIIPERVLKAKLKIEILTDAGQRLLIQTLPVSALSPPEAFKAPMPGAVAA